MQTIKNYDQIIFVDELLRQAFSKRASDIHIEPMTNAIQIRFRIDGVLYREKEIALAQSHALFARVKILANLDIAEKRLPQDGHFRFFVDEKLFFDARVSTIATILGEKIVIRLLPQLSIAHLQTLGMTHHQQNIALEKLRKTHGLILICGPTGSGKTRTLYTLLEHCDRQHKNICTIEEPVEIQLSNIQQIETQIKIGLSFPTILRALLRQDPDIILIGEIRDQQTAELAIHAANTGHLVLATVHANNTKDALLRLQHLGVHSFDIEQSIIFIIAQRLLKKLCIHCKKQTRLTAWQKELLKNISDQHLNGFIFEESSCDHCLNGYKDRTGIFEFSTEKNLLHHHAIDKLLDGTISFQELTSVLDVTS